MEESTKRMLILAIVASSIGMLTFYGLIMLYGGWETVNSFPAHSPERASFCIASGAMAVAVACFTTVFWLLWVVNC